MIAEDFKNALLMLGWEHRNCDINKLRNRKKWIRLQKFNLTSEK